MLGSLFEVAIGAIGIADDLCQEVTGVRPVQDSAMVGLVVAAGICEACGEDEKCCCRPKYTLPPPRWERTASTRYVLQHRMSRIWWDIAAYDEHEKSLAEDVLMRVERTRPETSWRLIDLTEHPPILKYFRNLFKKENS